MNVIQKSENRLNLSSFIFFIFPIFYTIQNPFLRNYNEVEDGLKLYHIVSALFIIFFLSKGTRKAVFASSIFFIPLIISSIASLRFESRLLNGLGFLLIIIASSSANSADRFWARRGAAISALAIVCVAMFHLPEIFSSMSSNFEGRSLYPTLQAGGVNIEASILILLLIWLYGERLLIPIISISVSLILFQTRAVLLTIPAFWLIKQQSPTSNGTRASFIRNFSLAAVSLSVLTVILLSESVDLTRLLSRFTAVGEESGSQGRLVLYEIALNANDCVLVGCGPGSASELIRSYGYANMYEDNFHSILVQQIIETGLAGGLCYAAIFWISYRNSSYMIKDKGIAGAIAAFFFMGFVQFNGFEFIAAFLLGLGLSNGSTRPCNYNMRERQ